MITQPFKTFISLFLYYFFYRKYVLPSLLKVLLIKRTLYFLSVIISYFICHWKRQFNCRNFKNLFRPSLSVSFIKCFLFLCYFNVITNFGVMILPPNSRYKLFHTSFSFSLCIASLGVIFIDEWIALLYWSTSMSNTSTNFLVLLAEKYF